MLVANVTINTTKVPTPHIKWLTDFAFKYADKFKPAKAKKAYPFCGWGYNVEARTIKNSYSGRHYYRTNRIIVRTDPKGTYPKEGEYYRFKNMPQYQLLDWAETFVHIAAHEIAHRWFGSGKDNEFKCELLAIDVLTEFRKQRAKYEAFILKPIKKIKEDKKKNERTKCLNAAVRWVKKYCKDNNITMRKCYSNYDDELTFEINDDKVFEGMGGYMWTGGIFDAMERLQAHPVVECEKEIA